MGKLITLEGGEGSGKGTIVKMLSDHLESKGFRVITAREPGSVEISEEIRTVIQRPREGSMNPIAELLLYEAARAQFVQEFLIPKLEECDFLVLDRFYDSTTVYQGIARRLDLDLIKQLNEIASQNVVPDLTFILDVSPETGFARLDKGEFGESDRLEQESLEFHRNIRQGYLDLARKEGRFHVVDTENNDANEAFEIVKKIVEKLL